VTPCIGATTAEKLEGATGRIVCAVDVDYLPFPPPFPHSPVIICPTHVAPTLKLSASILFPFKSRSFPCGTRWSPADNEKLQCLSTYMSSSMEKMTVTKVEGNQIRSGKRCFFRFFKT